MSQIREIVVVLDETRLIDSESYERRYRTWTGEPLKPGRYVVQWPAGTERREFDESARFDGPYDGVSPDTLERQLHRSATGR